MNKNYYDILGVEKTAKPEEIKKVYHKKAFESHPDKAPKGKEKEYEDKFKNIAEAYSILSDPQKRAQYDNPHSGFSFGPFGMSIEDIMNQFMGGRGKGFGGPFRRHNVYVDEERPTIGDNIKTKITIEFDEMVKGVEKEIKYNKKVFCDKCSGRGGLEFDTCARCNGIGVITQTQVRGNMSVSSQYNCPDCMGKGKKITKECVCKDGYIKNPTTITLTIPAGIGDGNILRAGDAGCEGALKSGDLYIKVEVNEHPNIVRISKTDVASLLKVNILEAICGVEKEVKTVYKKEMVEIPSGTQFGDILKIKGDGIGGGYHIVKIQVEIPKEITDRQKELLEKFYEGDK